MAEGNEYIYLNRLMDIKEVDKKLERIVREGAVKRFFGNLYHSFREYFSKK